MSDEDRRRWDERYRELGAAPWSGGTPPDPPYFTDLDRFPRAGTALEIACGRGRGAVWLAHRGLEVLGVDVSPVAVALAREHARAAEVADRCRFEVADLDEGLPPGPPVDVVLCNLFRDASLDDALIDRLAPGGLLAMACLSEVGHGPGAHRVPRGTLLAAFGDRLGVLEHTEHDGVASLLARKD